MPLLSVKNLSIAFHTRRGVVRAVDGISFELERGRSLGIVGESGSGKSVTCHSLLRLLPSPPARIESGSINFDGIDLVSAPEKTMRALRGNRISMIFQDPLSALNPYMTVGTQVMEALRVHSDLPRRTARERALEMLHEVGIPGPARRFCRYPHEFSGGMRQRVMIAMALVTEPEILVADEPTTALDVTTQAQILDLLAALREEHELTTIFVTHDLGVISGVTDDVLVMHEGRCVERGNTGLILDRPRHPYTRRLMDAIPGCAKPTAPRSDAAAPPALSLDRLEVRYRRGAGNSPPALDGVSLQLRRGEILGLVGESGSGKSTLARAALRLVALSAGRLILGETDMSALKGAALRAMRPRVQMIFQDPFSSLDPRMTVRDCLLEALRLQRAQSTAQCAGAIAGLMQDVQLDPGMAHRYPHELSGGQRQRVAIARALAMKPDVVIADEPVSALDVIVQQQILNLMLGLNRDRGLSILFISHDLSVIRYVSDRTAVMYRGRIVELDQTESLFKNPRHPYTKLLLAAVPAPIAAHRRGRAPAP